MSDDKSEDIKNRRIDLLYKNLEHASNAYFAVETIFPVWEAAFALIVGQLIVAYFNPDIYIRQQQQLAFVGLIIAFIWFILVSLNFQNASYMDGKIKYLHKCLDTELKNDCDKDLPVRNFINPWPKDEDKKKWTLKKIILGLNDNDKFNLGKALKSTWFYRRILPLILCIFWVYLLIYSYCIFIIFIYR